MANETDISRNPLVLLVAALIGGGGANLGLSWISPPDDGDRWRGSQHREYAEAVSRRIGELERRMDALDDENIRLWKDRREHAGKSQHEGAHHRMLRIEREHEHLSERMDKVCEDG